MSDSNDSEPKDVPPEGEPTLEELNEIAGAVNWKYVPFIHLPKGIWKIGAIWVTDCPQGLLLEPEATDRPGADPGLYPNAQEYIEKLLPRLEAVASQQAPGSTPP